MCAAIGVPKAIRALYMLKETLQHNNALSPFDLKVKVK